MSSLTFGVTNVFFALSLEANCILHSLLVPVLKVLKHPRAGEKISMSRVGGILKTAVSSVQTDSSGHPEVPFIYVGQLCRALCSVIEPLPHHTGTPFVRILLIAQR